MSVRAILAWPDPRLRRAADPGGQITDRIRAIWTDMIDTMEAMPGWGLAAPQIGGPLALAVVDASDERGRAIRMADPRLLAAGPQTATMDEASPNLPGLSAAVTRPTQVTIGYRDADGGWVERRFDDLWARSAQHQMDHLAGRLYIDRLKPVKRDLLLRKARKSARA